MSNENSQLKQRVDDLWKSSHIDSSGFLEIITQHFCESVEDEMGKLRPSQYREFMDIAKEYGYVPTEEIDHWTTYYTQEELEPFGL